MSIFDVAGSILALPNVGTTAADELAAHLTDHVGMTISALQTFLQETVRVHCFYITELPKQDHCCQSSGATFNLVELTATDERCKGG